MDREQAKNYIKGELENYLISKGIDTRKNFLCLNPGHREETPSMSYDRKRNKVHCFGCGADYDTFDLIGIEYRLQDPGEIFKKAYGVFGIDGGKKMEHTQKHIHTETPAQQQEQDYSSYYKEAHQHIKETGYPQKRGLSDEIINRFMLGYDRKENRLIIPITKSYYKARAIDTHQEPKYRIPKGAKTALFNSKALTEAKKPIFIVEGELDALSIIEVGGEAVGLGSTANRRAFLKILENQKPAQPIIIALDNDKAGEEAAQELEQGLKELNITAYRYNPYGSHKDANEALTADREAFKEAIAEAENIEAAAQEAEREAYLNNSAAYHLQGFLDGIDASVNTPAIPTGFKSLDAKLYGGLYEGLYIIGAISSLGKTTFTLQIADHIAQSGQDVLIFSLEMARYELIAKSVSRLTAEIEMQKNGKAIYAKSAREITDGKRWIDYNDKETALIIAAIEEYRKYAGRIFIHEGCGDIGAAQVREVVEKHITFTGRTPVVIIDYLQILAPYNERMTDKQNIDKAVIELKRISRDKKTPVIAISSFNRQSYNSEVTMEAFKESGAVEYSSDVLIGLQFAGVGGNGFKTNEAKGKDIREIQLVILKNRHGKAGVKIAFDYAPKFNLFRERGIIEERT